MSHRAAWAAVLVTMAAAGPAEAASGQRTALSTPVPAFAGPPVLRGGRHLVPAARRLGACARPARAPPQVAMQAASKFEIDGTLINIMDTMTFPSGFTKREFVVRTDEMYPQEVKFELIKDKVALIDSYSVNEQVKVSFNIRGSQWQDKYFTNLQAWKIQRMAAGEGQLAAQAETIDLSEWDGYGSKSQQQAPAAAPKAATPAKAQVQWDDDIPF